MFFDKKKKEKIMEDNSLHERIDDYGKGDGQPYLDWMEEKYEKMTDQEKEECLNLERKLNRMFGLSEDYVRASIYGFVVGDALGVPVEFLNREKLKSSPIHEMEAYGTHNQPKGTWSDDTSMVLATIDGLINSSRSSIDYKKIMTNFLRWKQEGNFTPFGKVFDIGNTTSDALFVYQQRIDNNIEDVICGTGDIHSNGNGSLMRILPISFYLYYLKMNYQDDRFLETIKTVSSMTHAHVYSILGCYIYTLYLMELLNGEDKILAYKNMQKKLQSVCQQNQDFKDIKNIYDRILYEDISQLKENEICSSGYVVDSLEAVLWSVLTSSSFEETALKAVNLGEDTDTIGALAGGIAGIIYGYDSILVKWINSLQRKDYIDEMVHKFITYLKEINSMNEDVIES